MLRVSEKFMDPVNCALGEFIRPISPRTFRAFRIIIRCGLSHERGTLDAISRTANYDVSLLLRFVFCQNSFFRRPCVGSMMTEKYGLNAAFSCPLFGRSLLFLFPSSFITLAMNIFVVSSMLKLQIYSRV